MNAFNDSSWFEEMEKQRLWALDIIGNLVEALHRFDVDQELEEEEETTITVTAEDQRILRAAIARATVNLP